MKDKAEIDWLIEIPADTPSFVISKSGMYKGGERIGDCTNDLTASCGDKRTRKRLTSK